MNYSNKHCRLKPGDVIYAKLSSNSSRYYHPIKEIIENNPATVVDVLASPFGRIGPLVSIKVRGVDYIVLLKSYKRIKDNKKKGIRDE